VSNEIERMAAQTVMVEYPTLDEVLNIVKNLPGKTEVELRNKCLVAFTYCTGIRDNAIRTLPFGAVNIDKMFVEQNPRKGTKVKLSKIIYSKIFPFEQSLINVISDYHHLLEDKKFEPQDPYFPQSKRIIEEGGLCFTESVEISRNYWKSLESVRTVFKESARLAGSKYFYPHLFRHAAIRRLLDCACTALEIKAIYQSVGHESFFTILESYANLDIAAQLEVLSNLNLNPDNNLGANKYNGAIQLIKMIGTFDEKKIIQLLNIIKKL
jgi:integrase